MTFTESMDHVAQLFEVIGTVVLFAGLFVSAGLAMRSLRRTGDGWKIAKRVMELLWGETKPDAGFLDGIGGRGPKVWARS